jgi:hypothetical protein
MTTDSKLRIRIITSKGALCCRSENWIINKRGYENLEAAQMRFLRPLLGPTSLVLERNADIHNRLKVDILIEDRIMSEELVRQPGKNGQKPHTQASFSLSTPGTTGCWKTQEKCKDQEHIEL